MTAESGQERALPESLVDPALSVLLRGRFAAWARLDLEGIVQESGGELERYGLLSLQPGTQAADSVTALHGLVPFDGWPLQLPRVQFAAGIGDLELIPSDGDQMWLLVLDTRATAERERVLFQKGNELDLLRARWAGTAVPDADSELATVLGALDLVVFERGRGELLRPLGGVPPWARAFVAKDEFGLYLEQGDGLTFLDNFLVDAEHHWRPGSRGYLSSGMWSEERAGGGERYLEAIAVRDASGREGLVLQQLGPRYVERQRILQGAREARLDLEALRNEVQKKDVLLHCIVHDLRGPLSSLVGALSLLQRGTLKEDKVQALLDVSMAQARRQDQMIRQVLDVFAVELNELEAFERDPKLAPDLEAVLQGAMRRVLPAFDAAGVELTLRGSGSPSLPVVGRLDRLERIVANLLDNARRYAPESSAVQMLVQAEESDSHARLIIQDRGPGVPPEDQERLFERFAQGSKGRRGVSGLGLYFCRITLNAWGGSIAYKDRPGGGACFEVRLLRAGRSGDLPSALLEE